MFCPKCKSLMGTENEFFVCRKCGFKKKKEGTSIIISKQKEKEIVVVDNEEKMDVLPKVKISCPKCGNNEAYWVLRQMRGSDEPESRFYTCTKCKYRWRED